MTIDAKMYILFHPTNRSYVVAAFHTKEHAHLFRYQVELRNDVEIHIREVEATFRDPVNPN